VHYKSQWNKCDFRARMNAGTVLQAAGGRLFHMLGSQAKKPRLPNWVRVRFTTVALVRDDLS